MTIDGPAASGKSTTARMLAKKLGWLYLDTGAMYRAITIKVLREGIPLNDPAAIGRLCDKTKIELVPTASGTNVFLDGKNITGQIRTPEVDKAIGPVCEVPKVRETMVRLQRSLAEGRSVVAEGRDMGTVVFPDAEFKFFMTASIEERVVRRKKELEQRGVPVSIGELKKDIEQRDLRDCSRRHSPLAAARDAVVLDTSDLTVGQQVQCIIDRMETH